MPNLPDVASATPEQRAAATDLLTRTEAATAAYADVNAAKAAGFDVQGTLAKAEQRNQKLAQRISQADATGAVGSTAAAAGAETAPTCTTARRSIPPLRRHSCTRTRGTTRGNSQARRSPPTRPIRRRPPDPGGPITRWSFGKRGGSALTMRVYFVPGNDLAHAYAMTQSA